MNLKLEDLFVEYPSVDNPNIQALITDRKEFSDVSSDAPGLTVKQRGQYFKHQLIVQRYLRNYDDLLIQWETGVGKSCGVIGLTEYFKNNRGNITRVYILAPGSAIKQELKNQIMCRCTPVGTYDTEWINEASGMSQRNRISRMLKKWYEITTVKKFCLKLFREYWNQSTLTPDLQRIEEDYSGTLWWIDEVHRLKIKANINYTLQSFQDRNVEIPEKYIVYNVIHTLFHLSREVNAS